MAETIAAKVEPGESDKDKLYELCKQKPPGHLFSQQDLAEMGVVDDTSALAQIINDLLKTFLFQLLDGEETCYKIRSRDDAARLQKMTDADRLVYTRIEGCGDQGVWSKAMATKTGLSTNAVNKIVDRFCTQRLVKPVENVKMPRRKVYVLQHVVPPDSITGGPWFHEGELDMSLIETISNVAVDHVRRRSWHQVKVIKGDKSKHHKSASKHATSTSMKRSAAAIDVEDSAVPSHAPQKRQCTTAEADVAVTASTVAADKPLFPPNSVPGNSHHVLLPYPPSHHHDYPTTAQIRDEIHRSGITSRRFTATEVSSLLTMLDADDRLERFSAGWRSVRGEGTHKRAFGRWVGADEAQRQQELNDAQLDEEYGRKSTSVPKLERETFGGLTNGFAEAPCASCPVFDICEDDGPVSAATCVYFDKWLHGRDWQDGDDDVKLDRHAGGEKGRSSTVDRRRKKRRR